jgi:hypothetical protein
VRLPTGIERSRAVGSPPWSEASAPIWAHVSGYSPRERGSAGLAFLRAFVDDSVAQKGDKRLFYAGYLHRADAWATFSEAWDWELKQWPAIEYFKGSGDQFDGWEASMRDAKIANLAEIIWAFKPFSFHFSLNRKLFEEALKPVSPYGFGRPHYQACFVVMSGVARSAAAAGITTPIEFIFDQQDGVDDDVRFFFTDMIKALPSDARALISDAPWFKSDRDKQFMPLQAADMLAWHVRREHEYPDKPLPLMKKLWHPEGHLVGDVPDEIILNWADHHKKQSGLSSVQSKGQWDKFIRESKRLRAAGVDPLKINRPGVYYPESAPKLLHIIAAVRRWLSNPRWPPRNKAR